MFDVIDVGGSAGAAALEALRGDGLLGSVPWARTGKGGIRL